MGTKARTVDNFPRMKVRGARRRREQHDLLVRRKAAEAYIRLGYSPFEAALIAHSFITNFGMWPIPDDPIMLHGWLGDV